MALSRRTGNRFQSSIWPGFVDAMTGLLLVLMFVLTIFMVVQFTLRETISGQASELDELSSQVAELSRALGLERDRTDRLQGEVGQLTATLGSARDQVAAQQAQIAALTQERDSQTAALDAAQTRITAFEAQVAALIAQQDAAQTTIADLRASAQELEAARDQAISEQEALTLALAQARDETDAQAEAARLAAARREALEALVADLRSRSETAQSQQTELSAQVDDLQKQLSEEEKARIAEAAAAEALRARLAASQDELTAMTLALEEQRRRAEETLTLLAAARTAREDLSVKLAAALLDGDAVPQLRADLAQAQAALATAQQQNDAAEMSQQDLQTQVGTLEASLAGVTAERDGLQDRLATALAARDDAQAQALDRAEVERQLAAALAAKLKAEQEARTQLSAAEQRDILLKQANAALSQEEAQSAEAARRAALLNQQVSALREQLAGLQGLLDDAKDRDAAAKVEMTSLGNELNAALARAAAETRRRLELEEAERKRLEAEKQDLENYRSEFFGRMRSVLSGLDGVRIVGDRFVFSSEVLFAPGEATLSPDGEGQIAKITQVLRDISDEIPPGIDWVLQVDGHTDDTPLSGQGQFRDNWELSQARALSVVRFMAGALGFPPNRLSANGFGQYQPIASGSTDSARAQNRRIELKFTEK